MVCVPNGKKIESGGGGAKGTRDRQIYLFGKLCFDSFASAAEDATPFERKQYLPQKLLDTRPAC